MNKIIIDRLQQKIEELEAVQKTYEQGLLNHIESMKAESVANEEKVKAEKANYIKDYLTAFCLGVITSIIASTLFSLFWI